MSYYYPYHWRWHRRYYDYHYPHYYPYYYYPYHDIIYQNQEAIIDNEMRDIENILDVY